MRMTGVVPALPVRNMAEAVAFYEVRLGFSRAYSNEGFARVFRDEAEIHLWAANDEAWRRKRDLAVDPVTSGAESFIAGTASCRVEVDEVDELYVEMSAAEVLHPSDRGSAVDTDWATREFATLDLDGNLLTFYRRQSSGVR